MNGYGRLSHDHQDIYANEFPPVHIRRGHSKRRSDLLNGRRGNWTDPSFWTHGVPDYYKSAYVPGGSVTISSGDQQSGALLLGQEGGEAHLSVNGGSLNIDGSCGESGQFRIGDASNASVIHQGGTIWAWSAYLGYQTGATGTYTIGTGAVFQPNRLFVGYYGVGDLVQNGGDVYTSELYVGSYETSSGSKYTLNLGQLITEKVVLGCGGNQVARFHQYGGDHWMHGSFSSELIIGSGRDSTGIYNLYGGFLHGEAAKIIVGCSGAGVFYQQTGSVDVSELNLSEFEGDGLYTLEGGTLKTRMQRIGIMGKGDFRHYGGTNSASSLSLGETAFGQGIYTFGSEALPAVSLTTAYFVAGIK